MVGDSAISVRTSTSSAGSGRSVAAVAAAVVTGTMAGAPPSWVGPEPMPGTPLVRATPGGTGAGAGRGSSGTWCVRRESIGSPASAGGSPLPARCREPAPRAIAVSFAGPSLAAPTRVVKPAISVPAVTSVLAISRPARTGKMVAALGPACGDLEWPAFAAELVRAVAGPIVAVLAVAPPGRPTVPVI